MTTVYPAVVLTASAQRRGRVAWALGGVILGASAVWAIVTGVTALIAGDTESTIRLRSADLPTWTLVFVGLGLIALMWWSWRRESHTLGRAEALINYQPMKGGIYLIGNGASYKGTTLPVADGSPLRVALVKTQTANAGLNTFYGLHLASAHGSVLMDVRLMPKALDLNPLLAECARRRITVELDPKLAKRHREVSAEHMVALALAQEPPAHQPPAAPSAASGGVWLPQ